MPKVTRFIFENEDDYKTARDIHLDQLAARGWKARPDLDMVIEDEDVEGLKQELSKRGVQYEAADAYPKPPDFGSAA